MIVGVVVVDVVFVVVVVVVVVVHACIAMTCAEVRANTTINQSSDSSTLYQVMLDTVHKKRSKLSRSLFGQMSS